VRAVGGGQFARGPRRDLLQRAGLTEKAGDSFDDLEVGLGLGGQ
jgi:hypothetical protein